MELENKRKKNYKTYKYAMKLEYEYKNKLIQIKSEHISNFAIYRDFMNQHRPLLYVTMNVDQRLLQDIVHNVNKKYIICTLEKITMNPNDTDDANKIRLLPRTRVFKDKFLYVIPSSQVNQNDEIDYGGDNEDREDLFVPVMIGLVQPDTLKLNNVPTGYKHYTRTHVTDLLLKHLSHIPKLVFSPIENNMPVHNTDSSTKLTEFIRNTFEKYPFYSSGYRFFFDYDKTYLVSNNGQPIKVKGEKINTVIFNVHSPDEPKSKAPGMITDLEHKHFLIDMDIINIEPLDTSQVKDKLREFNNAANHGVEKTPKRKLDVLYITKELLDTDQFTLNKEYFVDHYNKLDNRRGRFILLSKKDLYTKEGEFYKVNTTLVLKFIKYE